MGNLCGPCFKGEPGEQLTTRQQQAYAPQQQPRPQQQAYAPQQQAYSAQQQQVSLDTKRQQMAEAAERRLKDQENRGVKNPESVRRNQQKAMERERTERESDKTGGHGLRWTQD